MPAHGCLELHSVPKSCAGAGCPAAVGDDADAVAGCLNQQLLSAWTQPCHTHLNLHLPGKLLLDDTTAAMPDVAAVLNSYSVNCSFLMLLKVVDG